MVSLVGRQEADGARATVRPRPLRRDVDCFEDIYGRTDRHFRHWSQGAVHGASRDRT